MARSDLSDEHVQELDEWAANASVHDLMAAVAEKDADVKEINKQWKEAKGEREVYAEKLLEKIREMGDLENIRKGGYSATVSKVEVPNPKDWDQIYEYIKENDALYLLERRLMSTAWRELHNAGIEIPGVEASTRVDVSVRNVK